LCISLMFLMPLAWLAGGLVGSMFSRIPLLVPVPASTS
jgi:hypothetical protein